MENETQEGGGTRQRVQEMMARIEEVLAERGLTRSDLPRITGFKSLRFKRWFEGQGAPDVFQAQKIAHALRVPVLWLAGLDVSRDSFDALNTEERTILLMSRELGYDDTIKALVKALKGEAEKPIARADSAGQTEDGKEGGAA